MVNKHRAGIDNYVSENFVDNGERVLLINEKTKQGFAIARGGDGIYINRPHQKRGVVQKDMIPTIKTTQDIGVVVKLQKPSEQVEEEAQTDIHGIW